MLANRQVGVRAVEPDDETDGQEGRGRRLALLIDGDNAEPGVVDALLREVARLGEAIVRRIYGDFTATTMASWKRVLQQHSIKPVQQYAYTTGKNATDSTMIIDAMDLLYSGRFDGFCLVSSDSDFTGLATRLREEGLLVYGFGRGTTPEAFRNACHRFITTEVLKASARPQPPAQQPGQSGQSGTQATAASAPRAGFPREILLDGLDETADETGWVPLGRLANYVQKVRPDFDPRLYGFRKLSDLVRGRGDLFESETRPGPKGIGKEIWIRARSAAKTASPATASAPTVPAVGAHPVDQDFPTTMLLAALASAADDSGWASVSSFTSHIQKLEPGFDYRQYGYKRFADLVRGRSNVFEHSMRKGPRGGSSMWVRARTAS